MLKEGTLLFKVLIALDRLLNVLTGGSFMICLSTRSYIRSVTAKPRYRRNRWVKIASFIDTIMCEENHCKNSYLWEVRIKNKWLADNKDLV